ncbi:hypothetical protein KJ656_10160 [bacterium]|nr:hypothetical protein [bacterium]
MCKDNITFKRRPYEILTFVKSVGDKDPEKIEIGDVVILYLNIDNKLCNPINVKVTDIDPENHITGIIKGANKYRDIELQKGAILTFQEINVFGFVTYKKRS